MARTLFDQLQRHARLRPDGVALWQWHGASAPPSATTYAALTDLAGRYARAMAADPAAGAIIPLLLGKGPHAVAAMLGALGAGRAFAPLNRKLRAPQLAAVLGRVGPTAGVIDAAAAGQMASELAEFTRWHVVDSDAPLAKTLPEAEPAGRLPVLADDPVRPGCCLFTSGSTGAPKAVLIAERDLRARAAAEVKCFGLTPADVLLNVLPFSFDVGLNQLCSAIWAGCALVLTDSWLPADLLRAAASLKVTGISAVPAVWTDVMNASMAFDTRGAHAPLRYITVSGGDLPPHRLERLRQIAPGVGVIKTYGQTETFRSTALRPWEFAAKTASVGRPFGGARVYVCREDGRTRCAPGERGEIVHTGPGTMLGYLGERGGGGGGTSPLRPNPFHGPGDDAPLAVFTGDVGWLDDEGYLYLEGRRDGMLKVAGNRVYPREVAAQLLQAEGVLEAEVVGVKSPETGDTHLVAFAALPAAAAAAAAPVTPARLRRELASRLPSYMVPREVIPVDAIPRTASGKPDGPELLRRASEVLARHAAVTPRAAPVES